ncbi:MAG: PBP1A family penicillin-binding protein [Thermaerobacterales bacterium]
MKYRWSLRISAAAVSLLLIMAALGLGAAASLELPESDMPLATVLLDRHGREIAMLAEQRRQHVSLADMPDHLIQAVVAAEDSRFYSHQGIDPIAVARAAWANLRARRVVEGGSTISQQLAKNVYLTAERTLSRKLTEAVYTYRLEQRYTKDQILEMYLNQIYWGHGVYGIGLAAETYFGKKPVDLTLAESALLAGMIRSPENLSPIRNPEAARNRRDAVLARLIALGLVDEAEGRAAQQSGLGTTGDPTGRRVNGAPYFVDWVIKRIIDHHPHLEENLRRAGHVIHTTMDLDIQKQVEEAVSLYLEALPLLPDQNGVAQPQVAVVVLDPATGEVRAMVGGRNYAESPFNRAVVAGDRPGRSPGSVFKPIVYASVLSHAFTAVDRQYSGPVTIGDYQPTNFGEQPYRERDLTVRESLVLSDNVTTVLWSEQVGADQVIRTARALGVQSRLEAVPSLGLGSFEMSPLEVAQAYAPLAQGGIHMALRAVTKIESAGGGSSAGDPVMRAEALSPGVAFIITDILGDVLQWGTGKRLTDLERPAAGKTGTSQNHHDAWFAGYTPDFVAVVWIGADRPVPLEGTGGSLAGPLWVDIMARLHDSLEPRAFPVPDEIEAALVCNRSGWVPPDMGSADYEEYFLTDTVPDGLCPEARPAPGPLRRFFDWLFPGSRDSEQPNPGRGGSRGRGNQR